MQGRWRLLGAVAAAAFLLPGCVAPFHAAVDPSVVRSELSWESAECPTPPTSSGGPAVSPCVGSQFEVDYTFKPGAAPPFPAILQVFSVRDLGRRSTEDLLAFTKDAVKKAADRVGVAPDTAESRNGTRALANGLETHWFVLGGTVVRKGALFQQEHVRVRIIGEVGFDGRSSTSVVAVGFAQVASTQCTPTPIINPCQAQVQNAKSWASMAGDPGGTIPDARSDNGLIHNLVTHG